jgi:hypothetical protein
MGDSKAALKHRKAVAHRYQPAVDPSLPPWRRASPRTRSIRQWWSSSTARPRYSDRIYSATAGLPAASPSRRCAKASSLFVGSCAPSPQWVPSVARGRAPGRRHPPQVQVSPRIRSIRPMMRENRLVLAVAEAIASIRQVRAQSLCTSRRKQATIPYSIISLLDARLSTGSFQ